jgi:hypothetical protein
MAAASAAAAVRAGQASPTPRSAAAAAAARVALRLPTHREILAQQLGGRTPITVQEGTPDAHVLNPRTGKFVKASGEIGKRVIAEHHRKLEELSLATPKGVIPRRAEPHKLAFVESVLYQRAPGRRAVGAWRDQSFIESGAGKPPKTLSEFASALDASRRGIEASERAARVEQFTVIFEDERGERIPRTIHGNSVVELRDALSRLEHGMALHGSDPIDLGYALVLETFRVGYRVMPTGGARPCPKSFRAPKHPHFDLADYTAPGATGNDCLLNLARAVTPRAFSGPRNAKLRQVLNIPDGPIEASVEMFDIIGDAFRLRFRLLHGFVNPPDAERAFDDDSRRSTEPNRCTSKPELVVGCLGTWRNESVPLIDLFIIDGHYYHVKRITPPKCCPITGDELPPGATALEPKVIRERLSAQRRTWHAGCGVEQKPASHRKERVIVFDYETVYDSHSGDLTPYALGWLEFSPGEAAKGKADFTGKAVTISTWVPDPKKDISTTLLNHIRNAPPDVRYTLVSFNGARFDHFLLAKAAHRHEMLQGVFASEGMLRSITLKGGHSTLDLAKILPGTSLANACKDFGTSPTKLDGFEHRPVQHAYETGCFHGWHEENTELLHSYLARDVQSTASLFVIVRKLVADLASELPASSDGAPKRLDLLGPAAFSTAGSLAYAMAQRCCSLPPAMPSVQDDLFVRSAIVGGRVQLYEEAGLPQHVTGPLKMVDVVSLYPTAMAAPEKCSALFSSACLWGTYPGGPTAHATAVPGYTPGEVGIYRVTVRQQPVPAILPTRAEDGRLNWEPPAGVAFEARATQCDIELIREHGGIVDVHEGFIWRQKAPALFRPFVDMLMKIKNEQDALKARKDPAYNPSLRAFVKILLNSMSGKTLQRNFDDVAILASGSAEQHAAWSSLRTGAPFKTVVMGGETVLILGKKPAEKVYKAARAKPAFLGVLIYSYARAYVWKTICQHRPLYSDTDSGLMRQKDYASFRAAFPQFDPDGRTKVLGDFEEELGSYGTSEAFLLAPKDYAVILKSADGALLRKKSDGSHESKIRIKGVCSWRDRLIMDDRTTAWVQGLVDHKDLAALGVEYHGESPWQLSRPIDEVVETYLRRRVAGEPVHVLCSQLVRDYKHSGAPFTLSQRFLVKDLTVERDIAGPVDTPATVEEPRVELASTPDDESWLTFCETLE